MNATSQPQSKSQQDELEAILNDLYVSTHNGKVPEDIQDGDIDRKVITEAKKAIQSYIDKAVVQEANKARIEILERLSCCDNKPVKGEREINVCHGDHLELVETIKLKLEGLK
jgi:hypothetical protein